jgi:hypothetical protein
VQNQLLLRVEVENVSAPGLARFLMAINALHVAAVLTSESQGQELADFLQLNGTIRIIESALSDPNLDDAGLLSALAAVNSIHIEGLANSLRLTGLRSGSIESVIEELIDSVFGSFRTLLSGLTSHITSSQDNELENAVAGVRKSAIDTQAFNAIATIANSNAIIALVSMNAASVTVTPVTQASQVAQAIGSNLGSGAKSR